MLYLNYGIGYIEQLVFDLPLIYKYNKNWQGEKTKFYKIK